MRITLTRKLVQALSLELLAQIRDDAKESDERSMYIGEGSIMFTDPAKERYKDHINLLRDLQNLLEN